MTKVLLYSGGMDSWLIDKLWKPDVKIYVDVDGSYSEEEKKRLPEDVKVIHFPLGQYEQEDMFIPLRNLYFLMLASNYGDEICLGATAGDWGAIDKRPEFLDEAEKMINYLLDKQSVFAGKRISVEKKFVYLSKYELMTKYLEEGGNIKTAIDETFSCFNPSHDKECGYCKPCFRKFMVGYYFGYPYTEEQKLKMIDYIRKNELNREHRIGTFYKNRHIEGEYLSEAVDKLFAEYGLKI